MSRTQTCPICGKPSTALHKPFCSRGCVDRDLLQWLGEGYRLPAGPAIDEAAEADSPGIGSGPRSGAGDGAGGASGDGLDSADNDD